MEYACVCTCVHASILEMQIKYASTKSQSNQRSLDKAFDGAHLVGTIIMLVIFSKSVSFIQILYNNVYFSDTISGIFSQLNSW